MVATVTCPSNREGSGQPRGAPGCPVFLVGVFRGLPTLFLIFGSACRLYSVDMYVKSPRRSGTGLELAGTSAQFNVLLTEQE